MDRMIIVGAVLMSAVATGINKLLGGIVALAVTTGILLYGLTVYAEPGYCMALGPIELPLPMFLLLVLAWYGHDLQQIAAGWQERATL